MDIFFGLFIAGFAFAIASLVLFPVVFFVCIFVSLTIIAFLLFPFFVFILPFLVVIIGVVFLIKQFNKKDEEKDHIDKN